MVGPARSVASYRPQLRSLVARANTPLARGAFAAVFLTGLGSLISYPVQIFISRTLGANEYGRYAYALSLLNVAALVAGLDLGHGALRYAGYYFSAGHWSLLRGFLRTSRAIAVAASCGLALLAALVIHMMGARLDPRLSAALLVTCVLLVPASLIQLELNLLQALKRAYSPRIPNLIIRPLGVAFFLWIATRFAGWAPSARTALLANTAGVTAALFVSIYVLHRVWPSEARHVEPAAKTGEWVRFSVTTLAGSVFYLILSQQSDVIVVGTIISTREAGLYSAASQISTIVGLGVVAVTHYSSPLIAAYQSAQRDSQLRGLITRLSALTWAVSLPLVLVLLAFGRPLLRTFGPEFSEAYPVLAVMLIGQTINALWGALWGVMLSMLGYQRENFVIVVIVATFNLALTIILTPNMGIIGAAIATSAAVILRGILIALFVHRKLGFWPIWSKPLASNGLT